MTNAGLLRSELFSGANYRYSENNSSFGVDKTLLFLISGITRVSQNYSESIKAGIREIVHCFLSEVPRGVRMLTLLIMSRLKCFFT